MTQVLSTALETFHPQLQTPHHNKMGAAQSLIPQVLPFGVNVDSGTTENGRFNATIHLDSGPPGETPEDKLDRLGGLLGMISSMLSSVDRAEVSKVVNGLLKPFADSFLVQAATSGMSPDDLKSKHGPAITAVNAYTELILDCWDKSARTDEEIADLLARLESRQGSMGERFYAKVSGSDSPSDSSDETTD